MLYVFFMMTGCGNKISTADTNGVTPRDTGEETFIDCGFLNEEECGQEPLCTPIMASEISYNEIEECWDAGEKIFQECMSIDMSCGVMIVHARRNSSTECLRFDNSCIPVAWQICNEQEFLGCGE